MFVLLYAYVAEVSCYWLDPEYLKLNIWFVEQIETNYLAARALFVGTPGGASRSIVTQEHSISTDVTPHKSSIPPMKLAIETCVTRFNSQIGFAWG